MKRLTLSSAVCAVVLALLSGCSSDEPTEPGTAASPAPSVSAPAPTGGPAASSPAAAEGKTATLCGKVAEEKTALNERLKQVVSPDGRVPPAEGRKVMTDLAATLTGLAAAADRDVAAALEALAAEASKAANAADPIRAASSASFDAAGQNLDKVCTNP